MTRQRMSIIGSAIMMGILLTFLAKPATADGPFCGGDTVITDATTSTSPWSPSDPHPYYYVGYNPPYATPQSIQIYWPISVPINSATQGSSTFSFWARTLWPGGNPATHIFVNGHDAGAVSTSESFGWVTISFPTSYLDQGNNNMIEIWTSTTDLIALFSAAPHNDDVGAANAFYVRKHGGTGQDEGPYYGWIFARLTARITTEPIVSEACADIGMPYNEDRGCSSPYAGCSGPFHGFYNGVNTDLAMDAYNAGAPFNIQDVLSQDARTYSGRYRYGTARNPEDMRRYFDYNQQLLSSSQPYELGDIAFFDWDGDGLTNHVNIISAIDSNNRPLKMVDATGIYSGNPGGLALEHSWSSYYDQHTQGHGRLSGSIGSLEAYSETLQILRITVDSSSVKVSLFDTNGKSVSDTYDENLVANGVEASIPYVPGGTYADLGTQKIITVTQPLSDTTRYFAELSGQAATTYHLLIETLQGTSVTASKLFTQTTGAGEERVSAITVSAPGGIIQFTATSPSLSPQLSIPNSITLSGPVDTSDQAIFAVAESGGSQPIQSMVISATVLEDLMGGEFPSEKLSITPSNFTVAAGSSQEVNVQVDLTGATPGTYQGSLVLAYENGATRRIGLTLAVQFHKVYLPVVVKNAE